MKKILVILLTITLLTGCFKKEKEKPKDNDNKSIEELENTTEKKQNNFELSNVKIKSMGSMNTVTATIKSNWDETKTFDAILYLKNENGLVLGKIDEKIENLEGGKSIDITVEIMGDYTTVTEYQLVIENLE